MSNRVRRLTGWGIALVAISIMVVGLMPKQAAADPEQRALRLEQRLACPLCAGESLAESNSQASQDLKVILRQKIDDGLEAITFHTSCSQPLKVGDQFGSVRARDAPSP